MIINPKREILQKSRVLFIKDGCPHCGKYYPFIEKANMNLPVEKRIKVINCTSYEQFGVAESYLIGIFTPYFNAYPTLFIDGLKVSGSNSVPETQAWVYSYLSRDFITPEDNPYYFDGANCHFITKGFSKQVVCE